MNIIEKIIPSKTQRAYLQEIGYHFTDRELASLIYNSYKLDWHEKLSALHDLSMKTDDEILQREIGERLLRDDECQAYFEKSQPDEIVELLYINDEDLIDDDKYYFYSVEDAKQFAKKQLPGCTIRLFKHCVQSSDKKTAYKRMSAFEYYPSFEMAEPLYIGDDLENVGKYQIIEDEQRFEWYRVKYPIAFQDGDIVKHYEEDTYGIVEIHTNGCDRCASVLYLCITGEAYTGPFLASELEKIDGVENEYKIDLLQKAHKERKELWNKNSELCTGIYTVL